MEIPCGHFLLRPLQKRDKESLVKYANNIHIWRNVRDSFPHPFGPGDASAFIKKCSADSIVTNFCIDYLNECTGVISFFPQPDIYRKTAEIGYWLGEPFWGKGIMTTAVKAMTEYIFKNHDIVRLNAGVLEWNTGSARVLEKCGFVCDCLLEKAAFKEGKLVNEYRYGLVRQ
jgi:ribosomal-protein-alanine N-acetyltransferase